MNILRFCLAPLAAALLVTACTEGAEPPLAGASIGGPFTLTSDTGERVNDSRFKGQYRIMYFGYTHCPDVCPVDLRYISDGLKLFEKSDADRARMVTPIFVTVDPVRDTPPVLAEYIEDLHPRLVALTGTRPELEKVVRQFGAYGQQAGGPPGAMQGGHGGGHGGAAENYLVDHSRIALLMGPNGEPIAILPQEQGPKAIAGALDQWVA